MARRDRVIDAALGGLPARRAAEQFSVRLATAIRRVSRAHQTCDRTTGRQRQPRPQSSIFTVINILGLIEATPHTTISEMRSTRLSRSVMCLRLGGALDPSSTTAAYPG